MRGIVTRPATEIDRRDAQQLAMRAFVLRDLPRPDVATMCSSERLGTRTLLSWG